MKEYTRLIGVEFHGARLDYCHLISLLIVHYLIGYAREINRNFYILNVLFTIDAALDNAFVNRLIINILVYDDNLRAKLIWLLKEKCEET
ncbi:unnamed protein product [Rotaria sordida]|uniref:Glycogen debranching enzyme glucanotransferase domain-containing protein n=1 Tax=Rotaria sordida TaxID=392033 RepID=A0A819ETM4_9BILA|nr:unnamed protein product [Rotaria sordida]CAF1165085.1 unnamed protein product [Rotaria sordida]CAF3736744.1 unnamed protein product [Rotaria sordida]CAF3855332.1 unnamed protein product [Rotaria sordida]CAF3960748.1 unnamed protein product [Rotaria sordida]